MRKMIKMERPHTKTHVLKTVQPYFEDVAMGYKTFEIRKNDRDFQKGDFLLLIEWNQDKKIPGSFLTTKIKYITDYGQKDGYVILGIENLTGYTDSLDDGPLEDYPQSMAKTLITIHLDLVEKWKIEVPPSLPEVEPPEPERG